MAASGSPKVVRTMSITVRSSVLRAMSCPIDLLLAKPNNLLSDKYVAISNIAGYYA